MARKYSRTQYACHVALPLNTSGLVTSLPRIGFYEMLPQVWKCSCQSAIAHSGYSAAKLLHFRLSSWTTVTAFPLRRAPIWLVTGSRSHLVAPVVVGMDQRI